MAAIEVGGAGFWIPHASKPMPMPVRRASQPPENVISLIDLSEV